MLQAINTHPLIHSMYIFRLHFERYVSSLLPTTKNHCPAAHSMHPRKRLTYSYVTMTLAYNKCTVTKFICGGNHHPKAINFSFCTRSSYLKAHCCGCAAIFIYCFYLPIWNIGSFASASLHCCTKVEPSLVQ